MIDFLFMLDPRTSIAMSMVYSSSLNYEKRETQKFELRMDELVGARGGTLDAVPREPLCLG